jgi:hypothetical protein
MIELMQKVQAVKNQDVRKIGPGSLSSACKEKSLLMLCLVVRGIFKNICEHTVISELRFECPASSATGISVDAFK